jgi:hypothetical protein
MGVTMRCKQTLLFLAVVLCCSAVAHAQQWSDILAPSRAIDWSHAGAGTIPNRTTICSTLNPGATAAQINSAIANCPAGQVVFLNAGTYNISGQIFFNNKSNVTLRGAGPDRTFIVWSSGGGCNGLGADVCLMNGDNNYSGSPGNVATWTAGYSQGATSITLGSVTLGSISNLHVGSLLILDQTDPSSDTGDIWACRSTSCSMQGGGSGRSGRTQMQQVTVTSISGSGPWTIGITPGLYAPNWASGQSPGAWWSGSLPVSGDGIENLSMNHSSVGGGSGVQMVNAANCWIKGVRSLNSSSGVSAHVFFYQASHNTVRDSYFYGSNPSSEGYGVDSGYGSSDNLVENNIFQHIATATITEGDAGSVYAYNFAVDNYFGPGDWQQEDAYHHQGGDNYMLWEGNIGTGMTADDIHGTSFMVTLFRNRWTGRDTATANGTKDAQTNAVHLYAYNRYYNVVGNVLGTSGYHQYYDTYNLTTTDSSSVDADRTVIVLGFSDNEGGHYSGINNDVLVRNSLVRWGNYDTVNAAVRWVSGEIPSGISTYANPVPASHALPASFYLSAKPNWWGSVPWPPIGPDVTGGDLPNVGGHVYQTPAMNCYLTTMGGKTDGTSGALTFNANNCYTMSGSAPAPPTNLQVK